MTEREKQNEIIKKKVREVAEELCALVDSSELLLKRHEHSESLLAAEVDRQHVEKTLTGILADLQYKRGIDLNLDKHESNVATCLCHVRE